MATNILRQARRQVHAISFPIRTLTVGTGISPVRHKSLCSRAIPPVWNFTHPQRSASAAEPRPRQMRLKGLPHRGATVPKQKPNYSRISETTPEPTVLPPSRIAKRRPFSQAIGVMSSTVKVTWSPGRHISTPSGSSITPVTSVVLK